MGADSSKRVWDIGFISSLSRGDAAKVDDYALIILNQPLYRPHLETTWSTSSYRLCADGGANRLYDMFSLSHEREKFLPDLIKGDLDSVRPEVLEYYKSKGVSIILDPSQDATDFMKCVEAIKEKETEQNTGSQHSIIVLGGLSGRLDQTVHTLSYVHKLRKEREKVFVVTKESVSWVLDSGEHDIIIDHRVLGETCGLLPLGIDSTVLTTTGLRWNLTDHPSSFDGMVSTSNHLVHGQDVHIKTTKPIWWTVELRVIHHFVRI